jgi:hypothetical protein
MRCCDTTRGYPQKYPHRERVKRFFRGDQCAEPVSCPPPGRVAGRSRLWAFTLASASKKKGAASYEECFSDSPMPPSRPWGVHRLSSYSPIFPLKGPHHLPQDGSLCRGQGNTIRRMTAARQIDHHRGVRPTRGGKAFSRGGGC